MRRKLVLFFMLLLAGCGSSEVLAPLEQLVSPSPDTAGTKALSLAITALEQDGHWEVMLEAHDAQDLYQIAATVTYDTSGYVIENVSAGGGLGEPASSYFAWGEHQPGQLDFGYTKRYYGAGADGTVLLIKLTVSPVAGFDLGDFAIDTSAGQLLARDSLKHEIAVSIADGGQP